ncbi:dihydroorotase [Oligoflexus tunisiensis]|uniref:dihydroorotase n=1 Tax=Oligoflexus tunisiensis TaxID=708132 RepID=UPI000ADF69D5|nr:dihydroorotase [Oligoflexus tunisiensis]
MYHAYPHYVIKNVELWTAEGVEKGRDVEVHEGRVVSIHPTAEYASPVTIIDGSGLVLMPAGVDPQVHLRVPGQEQKETPGTGLLAALRGGVAAVLSMPNTKPVIDSVDVCKLAALELCEAEKLTGVRAYLSASITRDLKGQEPVDYQALAQWGVKAFTDDGVGVVKDELMEAVFQASAVTGLPVLQHAEYPGHGGVLAAGPVQEKIGSKPYPAAAEADMVARDLKLLARYPKARYHVLHASALETVELVADAKRRGLPVTCEVSPHHLWFTSADIDEHNSAFKMNPPLRSARDREALRQGLKNGIVDFVATDHAPHEPTAKSENFKTAAFGTTGLETSLRVLLSLWKEGLLSPTDVVRCFAKKPAEFLGIADEFGTIATGRPLKAALVNTNSQDVVREEDLFSLSKNNCFIGQALTGHVHAMFLNDRFYLFS